MFKTNSTDRLFQYVCVCVIQRKSSIISPIQTHIIILPIDLVLLLLLLLLVVVLLKLRQEVFPNKRTEKKRNGKEKEK